MEQADSSLLESALQLIDEATKRGVVLRLMGALAVEHRCPILWPLAQAGGRETADVDLVALGKQWREIVSLFEATEYEVDERHAMLHGQDRLNFFHPRGFRVDVFLDRLNMCHSLDLRDRLRIHSMTLPLADLLLQKLQIVELTRKDVVDIVVLLGEHEVGEDESVINGAFIASRLSGDWGFYHTATQNLTHIRDESLNELNFVPEQERGSMRARWRSCSP